MFRREGWQQQSAQRPLGVWLKRKRHGAGGNKNHVSQRPDLETNNTRWCYVVLNSFKR